MVEKCMINRYPRPAFNLPGDKRYMFKIAIEGPKYFRKYNKKLYSRDILNIIRWNIGKIN